MQFDQVLSVVVSSPETRGNEITDGQHVCSYADVPSRLDAVERSLLESGVDLTKTLAVESPNVLAGALLALALFRKGTSFILMPPVVGGVALKPTPDFCSHRLTVVPGPPGQRISIEANPAYNGRRPEAGKFYLRTSGSMGASKIVVHDQGKLMGNARNCVAKYGISAASRLSVPVPIAHMYGFGAEFLPGVMSGASMDLQEKTNVLKYLDREKKFQPDVAFVTPSICEMLLKAFKHPRTSYRVVVTSGQRISEDSFRAFDRCVSGRLINQYGSTEMGAISARNPGDDLELRATTIGMPMPGVELKLESRDNGSPADLYCRHPFGFEGYVDERGEWLLQYEPRGWYRTGDVAGSRADGEIVILGRADASVNRSGYLVLLSDIERVLERLESLGEVVVVAGKSEGKQGQRIAAFCVPRQGAALDGMQIRQQCYDLLPHYAIPDEVRVTESLPMLESGKVDRQTLAAMVS